VARGTHRDGYQRRRTSAHDEALQSRETRAGVFILKRGCRKTPAEGRYCSRRPRHGHRHLPFWPDGGRAVRPRLARRSGSAAAGPPIVARRTGGSRVERFAGGLLASPPHPGNACRGQPPTDAARHAVAKDILAPRHRPLPYWCRRPADRPPTVMCSDGHVLEAAVCTHRLRCSVAFSPERPFTHRAPG